MEPLDVLGDPELRAALLFVRGLHARLADLVPRGGDVPWLIGKLRTAVSRSA